MATSRPAHVLGDAMAEREDAEGARYFMVCVMTVQGARYLDVPAQYVLVGDELDDLYDEEDDETTEEVAA